MFSQGQAGTLVTPSGKVAPSGISPLRAARLNLLLLRLFTATVRPTQRSPASWSWRGHRRQTQREGPKPAGPSVQASSLGPAVQHREMLLIRGIRSSFSTSPDHLHINLNYSSEVQTLCSPQTETVFNITRNRALPVSGRERTYLIPAPASATGPSWPFSPGGQ